METEVASTGEDFVDLTKVRSQVRELVSGEQSDHALNLLEQISRWPDATRGLNDNVWMYGKLGELYLANGQTNDASGSFSRGFEIDPRELSILQPYSELLFNSGEFETGLKVVQSMILHHKRDLSNGALADIYRRMGSFYEGAENYSKARTAFEKALEHINDDKEALEGLLRVVGAVADPLDVIRVRQKLIRTLEDPMARSHALVGLGDDWINEFNDPGRALDVYEQAVAEHSDNKDALSRLAKVGAEIGDWRRVSRAYFTLSSLATSDEERADWIIRSSLVARDHLWEADKALTGFQKALELDPRRLDAFKAVTSILFDAKDWDDLEAAYVAFVGAKIEEGDPDPALMTVLWRKLAELYENQLSRSGDSVFANRQAVTFTPQDIDLHNKIALQCESSPDHFETAVEHLREIYRIDPTDDSTLDRLGKVFLRMKSVDKALCVYRALAVTDHPLDEKARGFVDRFDQAMFRPIERQLSASMLNRFVFAPGLDPVLNDVFASLKVGLEEWTGESHSRYGLKRKDRLKIDEPLAFNNIYKSIGKSIGYEKLPDLWHKPDQIGLINAALVPEGLIAGDAILGSGREEYTAFVIAKQLFLFMQPFYLGAIRQVTDLQAFFLLGVSYVRDDVRVEMTKERESCLKAIKKRVKGNDLERLRAAAMKIEGDAALGTWVEAIEDTANRIGLVFSDDMSACRQYLDDEPIKIGKRSADQRFSAVIDYSISEQFFELREQLGISVG